HAPTPSAAAELLTAAQFNLADRLSQLRSRLDRSNRYNLLRTRQRLSSNLSADAILQRVRTSFNRTSQHLDDLTDRLETHLNRTLRNRTQRIDQLEIRLRRQHISLRLANDRHRFQTLQQRLQSARATPFQATHTRLSRATSQLDALSPLRVLERGYALIYLGDGGGEAGPNPGNGTPTPKLLRNPTEAPPGTTITAQLAKGRLRAKVTSAE
ncbi:MAG: exodeoxyribonuclease VII large subunit, partial [Acidobacteriaceae bacterium]